MFSVWLRNRCRTVRFIVARVGVRNWREQMKFADERAWYSLMTKSIPKKQLKNRHKPLR